jgi:hypothetical protein
LYPDWTSCHLSDVKGNPRTHIVERIVVEPDAELPDQVRPVGQAAFDAGPPPDSWEAAISYVWFSSSQPDKGKNRS